jgi:VanZ family protein
VATPGRTTEARGSTETAPPGRTTHRWRLAFVGLVVVQLLAVYWPRVDVQGPVIWTDKVVHVLLFLAPTVAGLLAGLRPGWVVGLVALHAPVSELVQHFLLPNRSGDVWDAVADLSGVVLGVTLVMVWRARRRW